MRVLLINPNRFGNPPVPPLGVEYVAHAVRAAGHDARVLDLCFCDDPHAELDACLDADRPDVAMLSIRNVDSAVLAEERFYLDEYQPLAERVRRADVPLVVGGAGVVAMPDAIRERLHADTVVVGPGETAALRILDALAAGRPLPPSIDGFALPLDASAVPPRAVDIDYGPYFAAGGVAGFASSYGCPGACAFCIESRTRVCLRDPRAVACEVEALVRKGWKRFHLCDAEMNVSYDHALALCQALRGIDMRWMTYIRHRPFDEQLARAMHDSGCELATVTVNSATDTPADAAACVTQLRKADVAVAVDLSCGLPGERPEQARAMIDALYAAHPQRVGITIRYRVYPHTPLAERVRSDDAERRFVTGDPSFVRPAAYFRFDPAEVARWIDGYDGFALETGEAVNYRRLDGTAPTTS